MKNFTLPVQIPLPSQARFKFPTSGHGQRSITRGCPKGRGEVKASNWLVPKPYDKQLKTSTVKLLWEYLRPRPSSRFLKSDPCQTIRVPRIQYIWIPWVNRFAVQTRENVLFLVGGEFNLSYSWNFSGVNFYIFENYHLQTKKRLFAVNYVLIAGSAKNDFFRMLIVSILRQICFSCVMKPKILVLFNINPAELTVTLS